MSDDKLTEPVMDGANDATNHEKLEGLTEQVKHDHGHEGDEAVAQNLRERIAETGLEPEEDDQKS